MSHPRCWAHMGCGRQPGGARAGELGVCPAAWPDASPACWLIAGTFCGGEVQGTFADKQVTCMACPFFARFDVHERAALRREHEARHGGGGRDR